MINWSGIDWLIRQAYRTRYVASMKWVNIQQTRIDEPPHHNIYVAIWQSNRITGNLKWCFYILIHVKPQDLEVWSLYHFYSLKTQSSQWHYLPYLDLNTPGRRQSKMSILSMNVDQKSLETDFLIDNQKHCSDFLSGFLDCEERYGLLPTRCVKARPNFRCMWSKLVSFKFLPMCIICCLMWNNIVLFDLFIL